MTRPCILKVAVNVPLSREFDYLPARDAAPPAPGCRVRVPFGRRRQVGVVLAHSDESGLPDAKLRRADAVLDDDPLLSADDLWLIRFTSDYYHHPIGEVVAAALPALLRQGRPLDEAVNCVTVTDAGAACDIEALTKRAPRQAALLETLLDAGGQGLDEETLTEQMPTWRRAAKPLFEKGWLRRFETRRAVDPPDTSMAADPGPGLNADQQRALDAMREREGFAAFLLDGVTGSGKTEVYLQRVRGVLDAGKQVLVLVPEIGLTPQLVRRFASRLGIDPVVLHSGLTDAKRLANWRLARAGKAPLVIGTRSAVFTPMPDLGLIIVDEEHDHSLKQQEGLRYSARDLAIARAKQRGVAVVLGSATPTLEVLHHCHAGNFLHLQLPRRAGGATPPRFRLIDTGRTPVNDGLSDTLVGAIESHLSQDGQALVFLNRRGFAPTLICASCGHVSECEHCDSRMTVHARAGRLRCHHCGASRRLDDRCAECGAEVRPLGEGTERLEDALRLKFPARRIERIDSDSMSQRGALDAALTAAESGDADILVGTQMLSKGHHFPKLTLVGIVNADQGLFGSDFRSAERMAQSIIQVAGRAGRETRQGEVLIQTAFPDNPFWRRLIDGGYTQVAADALAEREASRWPPYTWLALIRSSARSAGDARAFLEAAREVIAAEPSDYLRVLGPVDAPMARRAGRYRAQLLLQSSERRSLHRALAKLRPQLEDHTLARRVRWSIDVDPVELF